MRADHYKIVMFDKTNFLAVLPTWSVRPITKAADNYCKKWAAAARSTRAAAYPLHQPRETSLRGYQPAGLVNHYKL